MKVSVIPSVVLQEWFSRVYLLSDVLSNCANEPKGVNIEEKLENILNELKSSFAASEDVEKAQFGPRILKVLRHWDTVSFLPSGLHAKVSSLEFIKHFWPLQVVSSLFFNFVGRVQKQNGPV